MSAEPIRMGEAPLRRDPDCPACLAAMERECGDTVADCLGCVGREIAGSLHAAEAFGPDGDVMAIKAILFRLAPRGFRDQAVEQARTWFGVLKERRARRAAA